jgi:hypothetical protein
MPVVFFTDEDYEVLMACLRVVKGVSPKEDLHDLYNRLVFLYGDGEQEDE